MPENCTISEVLEDAGLCNSSREPELECIGLVLSVMTERKLGKKSRWNGYFDFLPNEIPGMPMFWTTEELDRLNGTSLLDKLTGCKAQPECYVEAPCQIERKFREVVQPFLQRNAHLKLPHNAPSTYSLYLWATAVVSAYSFTIGDDRYQAMVPMWDALNHITGHANVRLHHCSKKGALQMIATRRIAKGEQVINSYGDLPNSELLRRYGFVEVDPNPHDCVEIALADLNRTCLTWRTHNSSSNKQPSAPALPPQSDTNSRCHGHLNETSADMLDSGSGGTDRHTEGRNGQSRKRARCSEPCAGHKSAPNCKERLKFLQEQSLVPSDGWFKVGRSGRASPELLEAARLLLLSDHDFNTFVRTVRQWRAPLVRPLSRPTAADMPDGLIQVLKQFCKESVQRCEGNLAPMSPRRVVASVKNSSGFSTDDMAAVVLRGEIECARQLEAWLDLQSPDGLLKHCSNTWKHIRSDVRTRLTS
ncbi:probable N-lysine methyltransferase setd6 at N-terminal half [Coccomyxa sp. Obi]|nr:probable N-lysine methyltransferase setd6 at N-terminal half [Coccomyxa sp. Obi]